MGGREILDSWKAIADYLRRDIRTCQRYERELELPVHRLEGSPRARVFAYTDELDAWRDRRLEDDRHAATASLFKSKTRAFLVGAIVVLAVGLAVFLFIRLLHKAEGSSATETISIAVMPFQNGSGRADLDNWTFGIPHLLTQSLAGSKYFSVLGDERITGIIRGLGLDTKTSYSFDDLRRIQADCGATHAVTGLLIPAGKGLVIALTTKRIGADEVYSSRFELEDETAIVLAADRMADQVKRDLGLTRTTQAGDFDATGVPVTTSSLEAFRLYNEGRRLHVRGDYAGSARIMRKALTLDPEFALAWRSLSASLESQGAYGEAGECLRKAMEFGRNASVQERYFIRVAHFHHKSEYARALQVSREWSSLYPDDTQARIFTGRACLFEEDAPGARNELNEALRQGDRNPFLYFYASLAGTASGRYDEGAYVREHGLSVHADNRLISTAGVIDAIVRGQYDRALGELDAMRGRDRNPSIELKIGDILLLTGDFRGAERAYKDVRPLSRYAVERLARLALAEGRYIGAAELAEKAGDHPLLAYVELRRGRLSEGLAAVLGASKSAEVRGHHASSLIALLVKGMYEAKAGMLDEARTTEGQLAENGRSGLAKAHERAASFLRGLIASVDGRHGEAVKEFRKAVELLPTDVPYMDDQPYQVGVVAGMHALVLYAAAQEYEKAGEPEEALDHYLKVVGLNGGRLTYPDAYALSHCAMGRIAEAAGNPEGARASYRKFLELWKNADPGLPEVADAQKRLAGLKRP
jgi:tetratricopeptide (TPR) repeat protein